MYIYICTYACICTSSFKGLVRERWNRILALTANRRSRPSGVSIRPPGPTKGSESLGLRSSGAGTLQLEYKMRWDRKQIFRRWVAIPIWHPNIVLVLYKSGQYKVRYWFWSSSFQLARILPCKNCSRGIQIRRNIARNKGLCLWSHLR